MKTCIIFTCLILNTFITLSAAHANEYRLVSGDDGCRDLAQIITQSDKSIEVLFSLRSIPGDEDESPISDRVNLSETVSKENKCNFVVTEFGYTETCRRQFAMTERSITIKDQSLEYIYTSQTEHNPDSETFTRACHFVLK